MRPGIQTFLDEAGDAACYSLCIIKIAERELGGEIQPLDALTDGINRGFVYYNWEDKNDNDNFFNNVPNEFLSLMAGGTWTVTKERADYRAKPGEHVVERWERTTPKGSTNHFKLPDWDSLVDSQTVKFGRIVSTRVFRKVA